MNEGDIILTPIPQADGNVKNRPAVFLREMPPFQDALVCGVSTQIHQLVPDFDELITSQDIDFLGSGLVSDSLIRLVSGNTAEAKYHRQYWINCT